MEDAALAGCSSTPACSPWSSRGRPCPTTSPSRRATRPGAHPGRSPVDRYAQRIEDWVTALEPDRAALQAWDLRRPLVRGPAAEPAHQLGHPQPSSTPGSTSSRRAPVPTTQPPSRWSRSARSDQKRSQSRLVNDKLLRTWTGARRHRPADLPLGQRHAAAHRRHEGCDACCLLTPARSCATCSSPPSASLAQAVGTTFTVDLAAALAVPLSFAARDLGDDPGPDRGHGGRAQLLQTASTSSTRPVQAAVPPQASDVLAFLEPVLHPVTAPRRGLPVPP